MKDREIFNREQDCVAVYDLKASRRTLLKLLGTTGMLLSVSPARALATLPSRTRAAIGDSRIELRFDDALNTQVEIRSTGSALAITPFEPSEVLRLAGGNSISRFVLLTQRSRPVRHPQHGAGKELLVVGLAREGVEKSVTTTLYRRYPGFAVQTVAYRNVSNADLPIEGWTAASHTLLSQERDERSMWTFAGASYADRRDWLQPVIGNFDQRNFMGMNASDYGGGTPCADVWRSDAGLAVGHVETVPQLLALPVTSVPQGTRIGVEGGEKTSLKARQTLRTPRLFLAAHRGDCFEPLATYGRVMAASGMQPGQPNQECYEPNWCAWGYERLFTVDQMVATLPKVQELGIKWAVLDDGWQTAEGDWYLDPKKFPGGEADIKALVAKIKAAGLKPKLWIAPLAVDPGTDLLRHDTDMLLLDRNGAVQDVTWWNSFYLCPAYSKTLHRTKALFRKIFAEWGFVGLKIDGQHLNGVAPCYNPAHRHARPEESVEQLQTFWKELFDTVRAINPDAVVELCPCGTSYAFHNMVGHNQSVASDPLSSWQVRHKGKVLKALGGPAVAYSGDHVELSDNGDDFASTVGIGAVPFTKFTWPVDPKPKDSFLLTPEREAVWRKWLNLYRAKMLPKGNYRGELYDLGFDKPEAHAIQKDGRMYYSFYAPDFAGSVELRGLAPGRHRVTDLWTGKTLGTVSETHPSLPAQFKRFLFVEAVPVGS